MIDLTAGKVIIGGVSAFVIISLLMKYNERLAWMYLIIILLGVMMVYRNIIFSQINGIMTFLNRK